MKMIFILLIFGISTRLNAVEIVPYSIPQAVIDTALTYKNTIDIGNKKNTATIRKFLASAGLKAGQPYCQAFVYYCFKANGYQDFKTGLANGYYASLKKKYGFYDGNVANKCGLIVWKYPNSSSGHIGFILKKLSKNYVKTLEANTSFDNSSPDGRLYKGKKGVFVKVRKLGNLGKMKLRGIVQQPQAA